MSMHLFARALLNWYAQNKRDLPWRHTKDPYPIWLSEIILQQTRVAQGMPYYLRFLEKYPNVTALAQAPEDEVLRLWQGLGYYSRARNLHAAAKFVAFELGGQFPSDFIGLRKLKGVGEYTAAAIASFAYNEPVAVVDGNVYRVLARQFGIDLDINSTAGKKAFATLANELIPPAHAGEYNQAIMEFGATHCKPANPDCMFCPVAEGCQARLTSRQKILPIKINKLKIKKRFFNYIVIENGERILMKKRGAGDVWQGLYDFPLIEHNEFMEEEALKQATGLEKTVFAVSSPGYKHQLTHQSLHVKFHRFTATSDESMRQLSEKFEAEMTDYAEIEHLPKPILIQRYLSETFF